MSNPAFEYVESTHEVDTVVLSKAADMIHDHAVAAAMEFAEAASKEPNDGLVHFFFDLFVVQPVIPHLTTLYKNKDLSSAAIDGVHFEKYGDQSMVAVQSSIHLWSIPKPTCYVQTILKRHDPMFLSTLALHCLEDEVQRAIETQRLSAVLVNQLKVQAGSIVAGLRKTLR